MIRGQMQCIFLSELLPGLRRRFFSTFGILLLLSSLRLVRSCRVYFLYIMVSSTESPLRSEGIDDCNMEPRNLASPKPTKHAHYAWMGY
ncbi:hypothetical protein BDZ97DRAFT_1826661 [Flammula alnicola]|nr:hypothetical protein BDZ97DRAFT_1826661 [Flammula alnicola]